MYWVTGRSVNSTIRANIMRMQCTNVRAVNNKKKNVQERAYYGLVVCMKVSLVVFLAAFHSQVASQTSLWVEAVVGTSIFVLTSMDRTLFSEYCMVFELFILNIVRFLLPL